MTTATKTTTRTQMLAEGTMKLREAAGFIGVSERTLYRLMDEGALPWVKVRGGRKIPRVALMQYLDSQLQCQ